MALHGPRLALESIGVSLWQSLTKLGEAELAALYLMTAYFSFQMAQSEVMNSRNSEACRSIFENYERIEEKAVHSLDKNRRHYALLAAIGILDSFLSDALRFLFLHKPETLPARLNEQGEPGESFED